MLFPSRKGLGAFPDTLSYAPGAGRTPSGGVGSHPGCQASSSCCVDGASTFASGECVQLCALCIRTRQCGKDQGPHFTDAETEAGRFNNHRGGRRELNLAQVRLNGGQSSLPRPVLRTRSLYTVSCVHLQLFSPVPLLSCPGRHVLTSVFSPAVLFPEPAPPAAPSHRLLTAHRPS